jgi:curved DNA-binding protein
MTNTDYYSLLGVSRSATQDEIKKAYKGLAKQYHPDRNAGDKGAENKFKEVSEAYQVLSDPEKRKQYDLFGRAGPQGDPGFWGGSRNPNGHRTYTWSSGSGQGDFHFKDLFSQIFGRAGRSTGTDDFAGGNPFFGSGGPHDFGFSYDTGPLPARDVEAEITIPFDEAMKGGTHRMSFQRNGNGTETLSVKIPSGINSGGRLRIPGKGEAGPDGRAGDLYLRVHVTPHRYFRREGRDLHLDLPVTVSEAALGATVEVPTLDGKAALKIPAGSQSGAKLRMKGKGAPDPKKGVRGDMYVHLQIVVPKAPNAKAKKIFEELKGLEPDPRAGKF